MSEKKGNYRTCFTRKTDGTRVSINWDNSKQCITDEINDPFWDRKFYNELKKSTKAKKVANKKFITRNKNSGIIPL